jgi:ATP-dependent helicase/nuclease subunit A
MTGQAAFRANGQPVSSAAFYALACDPGRSIAVEACAGAGKTWMLVSRILRALLDGCPPQDILAITFTRKAAGEMRKRLADDMRRWASLPDEALAAELHQRGLPEQEAWQRVAQAQSLHARVAAHGRPVQLKTFHSWFAALLRGAPLAVLDELKLPVQYELLEDDTQAIRLVWPRFYGALTRDPAVRQDFADTVRSHGRHQTQQALLNALNKRVEFALADAQGVVQRSVDPLSARFPEFDGCDDPLRWLVDDAGARASLSEAAIALGRASAKTFSAKGAELEKALTERASADALKALLTNEGAPRKFSEKVVGLEAVRHAQGLAERAMQAASQLQSWRHHQRMVRLSRVLLDIYAALKRERGWVDMSDVELAARRLLGDTELAGWMQQRLDARVRHLLIDEFQDTNPLQWQALHGWLSSYAGAGAGEAPSVFLVGDPKQSIYRFRRAEPQVFKAAQSFVVQGLGGTLLSCDHTRRCAPAVVSALNAAMLAAVQAGDYSSDFRTHTTQSTGEGAVLALPQVSRSERETTVSEEDREGWRDSLTTPKVSPEDTMPALEARQAARWVALEIAAGRLKPGELMVLARKRERLVWMFEALRELGIASEQPEKLDLCEAPAVQDVVALLDVLVSSGHDLSLARALKSPLFGWNDGALATVARLQRHWTPAAEPGNEQPERPRWWAVLQRFAALPQQQRIDTLQAVSIESTAAPALADAIAAAATRLLRYQHWALNLPPHDALSAIYADGDVIARFAQAVPAAQRTGVLVALRDLLAQALAQDGGRFLTAYRFVRALKAGGIPASPTHHGEAVRLLTIHGAKGLEAPTVLMLDTDSTASRPETMGVLIDWPGEAPVPQRFVFLASEKRPPVCAVDTLASEQRARSLEEINALYVAITRAESRLVISSFEPHTRGTGTSWYQRLQAAALQQPVPAPLEERNTMPCAGLAGGGTSHRFHLLELPALVPRQTAEPSAAALSVPSSSATEDVTARIGQALHRLLQWHPTQNPQAGAPGWDWSDTHLQAVVREFGLAQESARQALDMARRTMGGEAAWVWDAATVDQADNELDVFLGGALLRLDRLVRRRDSGEWWVLDYKSALRPELQPELVRKMEQYRNAVQQAQPGAVVRLAFINSHGRLIELPESGVT